MPELMEFDIPDDEPAPPPLPEKEVHREPQPVTQAKTTASNLTSEVLRQTRALLADESRWSRHALAELPDGKSCWDINPEAVKWGLLGAMAKARGWPFPMDMPYRHIAAALGFKLAVYDPLKHNKLLDDFNKTTTHGELLRILDESIAAAVAAEAS